MSSGPFQVLAGLRVVELTHMVAGPACGQILADLGAKVVKIEPPAGDVTRAIGPAQEGFGSALFVSANRGKESVFLDIREAAGAEAARALIAEADVVLCNIDAGMVRRAGLDAATLRAARPELIYLDVTGFGRGQSGGTDGLAQASMGLMSVTGAPDGPSFRTGATIVDVSTGVWGALAVVLALLQQKSAPAAAAGAHLEIALADVCLYMQMAQLAMHVADPEVVRRNGNHSMVSCTPMMTAADGRVMLTILHDRHWSLLCDLTGADPSLRQDPRFTTAAARTLHQGDLETTLGPLFATRPREEWVRLLGGAGMPCAPERGYDEVIADERLWKSGILQRQGESLQLGFPLFTDGERVGTPVEAPRAPGRAKSAKDG